MKDFTLDISVRWADLDPNMHLRHSVYYDWGAYCRITFLNKFELTMELMSRLNIGPILLREECVFRREIRLGDHVAIDLQLLKSKRDYSRWSFQHRILKNGGTIAATITVDGAWLDTEKRRMTSPPQEAIDVFEKMPLASNFQWLD